MSDADKHARNPEANPTEVQRRKPGSERPEPDSAATPQGQTVEAENRGDACRRIFDDLLARALDVPTPARIDFIETNCDDLKLRAELIELLAKEAELGEFLERPEGLALRSDGRESSPAETVSFVKSLALPETIGPFRILKVLGEGGMGVVYLAEQDEPVKRELAVKVVRADLTAAGVGERFMAERQALARLSHRYIAQMYEAGATEQGFPYFAMELISGEPITAYSDRRRLSIEERLSLFVQVCEGVQHAHQRGLIHRDLKPTNIMVSEVDGRPVPKLIDFGIAKALDRPLTDVTQLTEHGTVGTPAYMSPESLGLDGEVDVDTRTDVYALGVILYELLAGVRPYDLIGANAAQIVQRMMSEEVPRPSVRVSALDEDERLAVAANRHQEHSLAQRLAGDLDWITARATARKRERRYGSATELAADIVRHLRHEPVEASPPSIGYRLGKLVRRHRASAVAALIALMALVLGVVGLSVGLVRAQRAETEARQEAENAKQISDFLISAFRAQKADQSLGKTITAREILDAAAARIETELTGQPGVQGRLATVMGEVYASLGLFESAKEVLEKGLAWLRKAHGKEEHSDIADSLENLGVIELNLDHHESAVELGGQALAMKRRLYGDLHHEVIASLDWLAEAKSEQGDNEIAESMWREALASSRELGPDDAATAKLLNNLGILLARQPSRLAEAEEYHRQALAIRRHVLEPQNPYLAHSLFNLGFVFKRQGDLESAEKNIREAVEILRNAHGENHYITAQGYVGLAQILLEKGKLEESERLYRKAVVLARSIYGYENTKTASYMRVLAYCLCQAGKLDEAESLAREVLAVVSRISDADGLSVADAKTTLAECLTAKGMFIEAEPLVLEAFLIYRQIRGDDYVRTTQARDALVALYEAWNKPGEAEKYRAVLSQQPTPESGGS